MSASVQAPVLSPARRDLLRQQLDRLADAPLSEAGLARDPLHFVRQWTEPADQEIAAVFASALAFGRVTAFAPVIGALMDRAAERGGPRAWVEAFDAADRQALAPLRYRWLSGDDLSLLALALRGMLHSGGSLGDRAAAGWDGQHGPEGAQSVLRAVVEPLRASALAAAPQIGLSAARFDDLPRGLRYLLPLPGGGSACKRWCMFLRWMVRRPGPGAAGVDLGVWDLPTDLLVVPLDTHVHRIARLLGLTLRSDGSWRTAVELTRQLALLDPQDPARYDFALAHLGISGGCRSAWQPAVCGPCALLSCCAVAAARSPSLP